MIFQVLKAFTAAALLVCASGCARIGDPLPPLLHIPQPSGAVKLRQIGSRIHLSIPLPERNTDGSPLQGLLEVRIYRSSQPDNAPPAAPDAAWLRQAGQSIATLRPEDLQTVGPGGAVEYVDSLERLQGADPYRSILYYGVEFVGLKKRVSDIAGIQRMRPAVFARPVTVRAVLQPESIRLEWDAPQANVDGSAPARIAGYRVYRSLEEAPRFDQPVATLPAGTTVYEDRDMVLGRPARYAVSVVAEGESSAESALSETLTVEPRDIFPPTVPQHLEAFGLAEGISLRWDANAESDLLGYHLYRSESASEIGRKLTEKPLERTGFLDRGAERQKSYFYRLSSVDRAGNESRPTDPVTAQK